MALALVLSSATMWSSECRTSSRLPSASSTTQTMSTLAMLTAAFRQKFCQALPKAKSMRFQIRCMVPSRILVPDNLAAVDCHHAAAHHIDNLPVVRRHQHGGAPGVDLQEQLDNFPGRGGVRVPGRFVRQTDLRFVHGLALVRNPLLLPTRELVGI